MYIPGWKGRWVNLFGCMLLLLVSLYVCSLKLNNHTVYTAYNHNFHQRFTKHWSRNQEIYCLFRKVPWLALSEMAPKDPHFLVLTCLCNPSPLVWGLDVVNCSYQTQCRKSDGMSLPRLGYKRLSPFPSPLPTFCFLWWSHAPYQVVSSPTEKPLCQGTECSF